MIRLQHLQAVEESKWGVVLWCFLALMSLEIYSIVPLFEKGEEINGIMVYPKYRFFPFHTIRITMQVFIDYLGTRLGFSMLLWAAFKHVPHFQAQIFIFWVLSVGYLLDYLLIYNDPITKLPIFGVQIPLSYTTFMVLLSMWVTYKTWKTQE